MKQTEDGSLDDRLNQAVGNISEAHIEEALATETPAGLRADGKKKNRFLRLALPLAAGFCLLLAGAFWLPRPNAEPPALAQLANPMTAVGTDEELSRFLGSAFPVLRDKQTASRFVFANEGRVFKCEARYTDGTSLGVLVGETDDRTASGVYGAKPLGESLIEGFKVRLYTYETTDYAILTSDGYTYCYYLPGGTLSGEGDAPLLSGWLLAVRESKQN